MRTAQALYYDFQSLCHTHRIADTPHCSSTRMAGSHQRTHNIELLDGALRRLISSHISQPIGASSRRDTRNKALHTAIPGFVLHLYSAQFNRKKKTGRDCYQP
ncbi:hypothetical protein ACMFMG_007079 [Clarireedia jacksonii]